MMLLVVMICYLLLGRLGLCFIVADSVFLVFGCLIA